MPIEIANAFAPTTAADLRNAITMLKTKIQLELNKYDEETATPEQTEKYNEDRINYEINSINEETVSKLKDDYVLTDLAVFNNTASDLSLNVADTMYDSFCDADGWCKLSANIFASDDYMNNMCRINKTVVRG